METKERVKNILVVSGLCKSFKERKAVDNISFSLEKGQTMGLLGPNGAGKTTLLQMLAGLSPPTAGSATVFGYDLIREVKEVQARIGVVFEQANLFEELSAYQNLALFCRLYARPLARIQPLLERMGLWERAYEPVKNFSRGLKQRLLILRALIHRPPLLLLDEPCACLDPVSSRIIRNYLLELKNRGVSMLLASHNLEDVESLCDKVCFINRGRLVLLDTPSQLKITHANPMLRVVYRAADGSTKEELAQPTLKNLWRISELYNEGRVLSVHSSEGSLNEVFQKVCSNS